MSKKYKIKAGDNVIVTSGSNKGKKGKVLSIISKNDRVIVEGVNIIKKHIKPSAQNPQGNIQEVEAGIHISNLALLDSKSDKATKVGFRINNDKKERFSKLSNELI